MQEKDDEIPWNVKQKIIDFSDVSMMPTLRQLTQQFKLLVDNSAITYQCLKLLLIKDRWEDYILINLKIDKANELSIEFRPHPDGYSVKNGEWKSIVKENKAELSFINGARLHLTRILEKNPKIRFEELQIIFCCAIECRESTRICQKYKMRKRKFLENLEDVLSHKLSVKSVEIRNGSQDDILQILKCVQPGILEIIRFGGLQREKVFELDQVVKTDQWRHAKQFYSPGSRVLAPFSTWAHFSNVEMFYEQVEFQEFKAMIQFYSTSPTFKHAELFADNGYQSEILDFMAQFPRILPNRSDGDEWRVDNLIIFLSGVHMEITVLI